MVNSNLVLTILCVTVLQLLLLICSFIFNSQKLNILSTSQCKFWTWTKTCERKINFSLLAGQMFSCSAPALLLLHWRLFWFHFLLKLLLFRGKRNVVSLLCLYLLKKDQMRSDQWSVYKFISEFWDSPVHPWISAKPNQRVPCWSLDYHVTCHFFLFVFCATFAGHVVFLFIKHQPWKDLNHIFMFFCMKWECQVKKIIFSQWLAKLKRVHSKTMFLLVFGMHVTDIVPAVNLVVY